MTIPMSYGINIVKISLLCVLNKKIPLKLIRQKFIRYHTQRYIFTKSGKVSSIKINKNILKRKYLKKFEIFIKKNQNLKRVSSHPDRRGMIICSGSNYENSIKNSNFIVNNLKINFRK